MVRKGKKGTKGWKPDEMEALAQAVFDKGTRWEDIAAMQHDKRADYTPRQLEVYVLRFSFEILRFQAPQCASFPLWVRFY